MNEENPIIEEIRRTREQLLAKHDGDLDSLVTELQSLSAARIRSSRSNILTAEVAGSRESVAAKKIG